MPLLDVRSVSVFVAGKSLLQNVDLTLEPGEIVALTGASGSGKTSLLRVLCGLEDAVHGTIHLRNKTPTEWGWPVFRRNVLLLAQKPSLMDATVEENLRHPFRYTANKSIEFSRHETERYLSQLQLDIGMMAQNALTLSVGQQQRVCIVRALLLKPTILLMDEPTSALDADATASVEAAVRDFIRGNDASALVVTHNSRQVSDWCDRTCDITRFHGLKETS